MIWRRKTNLAPKELNPKTITDSDRDDDLAVQRRRHGGNEGEDTTMLGGSGINRTRRGINPQEKQRRFE